MTAALLELDWLGGWSERRLRRRRPGIDELPWGTLQLAAIDPVDLAEARAVWTNGVFTEYASAAAFSQLTTAMLEAGAPVDLTAASADIVVDELHHVELVSRLVMELGGAVPYQVDLEKVTQLVDGDARAVLRAAELAVTTSGVGEALSVPALTRSRSLTTSPLVGAVLDRLVHDEGPHAQLGLRLLAWAGPRLSAGDRAHLAAVAVEAIAVYAPLWQDATCACPGAPTLGAAGFADYRATMLDAVEHRIVRRLHRVGIEVDRAALAPLLA